MQTETTSSTDDELLAQLALAVGMRECSARFGIDSAYKLGLTQGRLEAAKAAVDAMKEQA
jgi:hypothetical protein